jgi:hypothetical protein
MVFSSVPVYLDPPSWQQVMFSSISIHIASFFKPPTHTPKEKEPYQKENYSYPFVIFY